jgi:hypothetical protein
MDSSSKIAENALCHAPMVHPGFNDIAIYTMSVHVATDKWRSFPIRLR